MATTFRAHVMLCDQYGKSEIHDRGALLLTRWRGVLAQYEQYLVGKGVLETTGCRALSGLRRRESRRDRRQ